MKVGKAIRPGAIEAGVGNRHVTPARAVRILVIDLESRGTAIRDTGGDCNNVDAGSVGKATGRILIRTHRARTNADKHQRSANVFDYRW